MNTTQPSRAGHVDRVWRRNGVSLALAMLMSTTLFGAAARADTAVTTVAPMPPSFVASRAGDGSINVSLTPASADKGTQKAVFMVALLKNEVYVRARSGWMRWSGSDVAQLPSIDGDAATGAVPRTLDAFGESLCVACADMFSGLRLYVGYGANAADMLAKNTYREALYLRPSVFTPDATDLQDTESAYYAGTNLLKVRLKAVAADPVTIAIVNTDLNSKDTFVPEMKVHFSTDDYPVDGKTDNAKLRMRGESSRLAEQKSYRVKLSSGIPLWRGEQTLQFNKHPYDLTRMRNKLSMDLFRDIPHINSLRTQFAHIMFDDDANAATPDVDYGLFTHVEKMGKEYLGRRGFPTTSVMYKAEEFKFIPDPRLALKTDGTPVNQAAFELVLSIENAGNHALLLQMLDDVNNSNADFNTVFAKYFNRNNYLTWLATSILMGNRDTRDQNFGLLQLAGTTRYYLVPWDYDGAMGWENQTDIAPKGKSYYADWQYGLSNWWESPLHRRFLQQSGNLDLLIAAVDELREKYLNPAQIENKVKAYKPVIETLVNAAPDANNLPLPDPSVTAAQRLQAWNAEVQRLNTVIDDNYNAFRSRLENPMPFFQSANTSAGKLVLEWDASVDLQGDAVSYTVQVASQPNFASSSLKVSQSGLTETSLSGPALPAGTYYLKVVAKDSKGNQQTGFETTVEGTNKYFGVLKFSVN